MQSILTSPRGDLAGGVVMPEWFNQVSISLINYLEIPAKYMQE